MNSFEKLKADMEKPLANEAQAFLQGIDKSLVHDVRANFAVPELFSSDDSAKVEFGFRSSSSSSRQVISFVWTSKLESELQKRKIKMATLEEEAARFGTLLLSNLRYPDIVFGKDYTDHVLTEVLSSRFAGISAIENLLANIPFNKPTDGPAHRECLNYLQSAVNGIGNSLVLVVGYDNPRAFAILVGAVVYMLDRRHSISLRRVLFPK